MTLRCSYIGECESDSLRGVKSPIARVCEKATAVTVFRSSQKRQQDHEPMENIMLNEPNKRKAPSETPALHRLGLLVSAALLTMVWTNSFAKDDDHQGDDRFTSYRQINLVSDQPGVALLQDTNLVNAWGVSFSPASPFWVSGNGTGKSTLYSVTNDASGSPQVTKLGLEVNIPGEGNPT